MRTSSGAADRPTAAARHRRRPLAVAVAVLVAMATAAALATDVRGTAAVEASGERIAWRPRELPTPPGTFPSIRRSSETWCGSGETAADRTPQGSFSSSTIRVLYAVPSDLESRFGALASAIVTDVAAIDRWWQAQDPTRTPRWDTAPSATCTGLQALDLGSVRLPRPASAYATEAGFSLLASDVGQSVGGSQKALVFFDGGYQDPDICGISYESPTDGGRFGVATMALRSTCGIDIGTGGLVARVAAHELTHDLGAVEPAAPHSCPDSGHVCDLTDDLMYPYVYDDSTLESALLDPGRDDYYGHGGSWFDVQDSGWLAHLPRRAVVVSVVGGGRVTSAPAGVDCGTNCTAQVEEGESVTLTAVATPPNAFAGWTGACTGTSPCALRPATDVAVQATFVPPPALLRVTISARAGWRPRPPGSPARAAASPGSPAARPCGRRPGRAGGSPPGGRPAAAPWSAASR